MNRLSAFFEETDQGVGTFYPTHHIVAVFPTSVEAARAQKDLERAASGGHEVLTVTGDEVIEFASKQIAHAGLLGAMMRELSRLIGTEAQYVDQDLAEARKRRSVCRRLLSG